ncbi:LON peptidase substrate-binding domain-containing protein [soil metagenome]
MQANARLPLFPLGLVLFPGVSLPLHLFEPRYCQLLTDVQAGDRRFGIVCPPSGVSERALPTGLAGCVAEVTEVESFEDGRSNVMVVGRERFALENIIVDAAPYLVADVVPMPDIAAPGGLALSLLSDELRSHFARVVTAVHTLEDNASAALPPLPDDPSRLAWSIASMIEMELSQRQRLLEERSPLLRVEHVNALLRKVLPDLELRAALHGL